MSSAKDNPACPQPNDESKDAASDAGRIVHDARGNAVWKWDNGSSTASTSKMLRQLDLANLRVEDAAPPEPQPPEANTKKSSGYGPGYNPYDRTVPVRVAPLKKPSR
jgi:hypothetical protein